MFKGRAAAPSDGFVPPFRLVVEGVQGMSNNNMLMTTEKVYTWVMVVRKSGQSQV